MEKQRLISSYDEINDTFVGKIEGKNGYCADYNISDGIFLAIDENNVPFSIFVDKASGVFNIPKMILESANVKIALDCDAAFLNFNLFIEGLKICSLKSENRYGMPEFNFCLDSNYWNCYFFYFLAIQH